MESREFSDASGREWRVHDYSVYTGKTKRDPLGHGRYRGFEPLDGGARRTLLLEDADRERGLTDDVLREQLDASKLYSLDDPERCARRGRTPQRVDALPACSPDSHGETF